MKLLLDENLSRRIVPFLQEAYPESSQVVLLGLQASSDRDIWDFARSHGYVIVTRDSDFLDLSLLLGQPPKVVRLRTSNQTRSASLGMLLKHRDEIEGDLIKRDMPYVEVMAAATK